MQSRGTIVVARPQEPSPANVKPLWQHHRSRGGRKTLSPDALPEWPRLLLQEMDAGNVPFRTRRGRNRSGAFLASSHHHHLTRPGPSFRAKGVSSPQLLPTGPRPRPNRASTPFIFPRSASFNRGIFDFFLFLFFLSRFFLLSSLFFLPSPRWQPSCVVSSFSGEEDEEQLSRVGRTYLCPHLLGRAAIAHGVPCEADSEGS